MARVSDKYVALAGEVDSRSLEIHELLVAPDRTVQLGPHRPVEFPPEFMPAVLHGIGKRLFVGGAKLVEAHRIRIDYGTSPSLLASPYMIGYNPPYKDGTVEVSIPTLLPALFEIRKSRLLELSISDITDMISWGVVTDIVTTPDSFMALRIEGSRSHEEAYGERVVIAETTNGGATWAGDTVASDLGESWPGGLTIADGNLVTITVDQAERRTIHQRSIATRTAWNAADAGRDGIILGAVSGRSGSVVVLSSADDRVVRQRYETTTRKWLSTATDAVAGDTTHAVMTVGGVSDEWLAIGQRSARLIKETF